MAMTSRERVRLALEHKQADRVAIHDSPWGTTMARWRSEGCLRATRTGRDPL